MWKWKKPDNLTDSSKMNRETKTVTWRLEKFPAIRDSNLFSSQKFNVSAGETIEMTSDWTFSLKEIRGTRWVHIILECKSVYPLFHEAHASFVAKIMNAGGGDYSKICRPRYNYFGVNSSDPLFSRRADDLPLLDDGCLVIEIELTLHAPRVTLEGYQLFYEWKFVDNLRQDLARALTNPSPYHADSETKIRTKDNQEFVVNRGILAARSPVFKKLFQQDDTQEEIEGGSKYAHVADIGSKAMAVLLRFVYTATLLPEWSDSEVICQLVYAANKYQLLDLLEFLDKTIGKVCSDETGGKLLNLAMAFSLKQGERELFEYTRKSVSNIQDLIALVEIVTTPLSDII